MTFRNILAASAATVTLALVTTSAMADTVTVFGKNGKEGYGAKFAVIQRFQPNRHGLPPAGAPTWSYSFKYGRKTYTDAFIGTAPTTNSTTTIPVYLVPMAMTYGSTTYDPTKVTANGVSIVQNVLNSPLFQSSVNYTQGGTNIGTTQYEDAFQRATLWGTAKSYPNWHTIFGTPTVEPVQTFNVGTHGELINAFGASNLILANISYFDSAIQKLIGTLKIPSTALPLFITTNTYLSSTNNTSGCCIGGYHSVYSSQPYAHATYITTAGAFAQDVSALSHELGEYIDDPSTNNSSPCGVLEVGDPLEGNANYGGYPYTVGGVTWNLQDLATLEYFGAPANTSINNYFTFQGESIGVCANGS
jgi:hypothetical protein